MSPSARLLFVTSAEALAACEATVRRADPDRWFAALFAPAGKRPLLYALYALNHELARIPEIARDPLPAEIRLQWWRDAVQAVSEGRPPNHAVAAAVAELLASGHVRTAELESLVDARLAESSPAPFTTLAAMEDHAAATSARLMHTAARIVAGPYTPTRLVDEAGTAYGLAGLLRNFRSYALQGKIFLPADLLAAASLSAAEIVRGKCQGKLKLVFEQVARCARQHFRRAENAVSSDIVSAVLPASLVPAYLSRITKNADPYHDGTDVLRLRKQIIMLRAAMRGRL